MVRERVTATVVLQRHVAVEGSRGVRVIARRAPSGRREVSWLFEYDEGIDPADPFVAHAAERGAGGCPGGRRALTGSDPADFGGTHAAC